jgi:lipopolysaccharide transport system ATP-binding protein
MSDLAIRVEGISKLYRLGTSAPYHRFSDLVIGAAKLPIRAAASLLRGSTPSPPAAPATPVAAAARAPAPPGHFWALKDVSFDVKQGEVVGIIGRNGAGKSTLLKILSRITEPTEGQITVRGRVGSLLEVGTGFHPELTGRENVFLNGAILGMTRPEIRRKFDEIVAFAEIEQFLDTPVKHYSSGMYMRLAFAVAAHLEPEILVVDEVLAVGDIAFQRKCLGKMGEVARAGRTVLLVTHTMSAVSSLCSKGVVLDLGNKVFEGGASDAVAVHARSGAAEIGSEWSGLAGDEHVSVERTWVRPTDPQAGFDSSADLEVGIAGTMHEPVVGLVMGFTLWSQFDYELAYVLYDDGEAPPAPRMATGPFEHRFVIPAHTLAAGMYRIQFDVGIHNQKRIIDQQGSLTFRVDNTGGLGRRFITPALRGRVSLFRPGWSAPARAPGSPSQSTRS